MDTNVNNRPSTPEWIQRMVLALFFIAIVFPLALAWGYSMQKTDAVWASILFHAGTDIPIFLGIFSALP